VHNALLFAFDIGDTAILTNQFLSKYKQIQTKDAASGISALEKQFQVGLRSSGTSYYYYHQIAIER